MTASIHTHAAPRAGILVTGTEVLTGVITDRNGPWLSERLRELGVDAAMIEIVGDRPTDLAAALAHMRDVGMTLIVTSGGLGPTADDLTAEIVGDFCGREMYLDEPLSERIDAIVRPLMARWPGFDGDAVRAANVKQATVPRGATVLEPVGTAPGLVVPPADGSPGPTVVVLPGPPGELRPMWRTASETEAFQAAVVGAPTYRTAVMRLFGMPESAIAESLRAAESEGLALDELEITTCLRRGEIEIGTRYEPAAQPAYDRFEAFLADRHGKLLFSPDGTTIDEQLGGLLVGRTIAVAESCTAGLLAARLTDRAGSSAYFLGGGVVYSNAAKIDLAGVDPSLIERFGAVSGEVAEALASGIAERFGASLGVGITGIAGPDGGTPDKPVGTVCISVWERTGEVGPDGRYLTRRTQMPGNRSDVRDRSVTVAMHLLRQTLTADDGD
ncbi:MAG: competence/damage-inducible protein A [Solirubrobacteraceae bacterium]